MILWFFLHSNLTAENAYVSVAAEGFPWQRSCLQATELIPIVVNSKASSRAPTGIRLA